MLMRLGHLGYSLWASAGNTSIRSLSPANEHIFCYAIALIIVTHNLMKERSTMPFDHLLRSRQTPLTMALLIVMAIVVSACGTGAPSAAIAVPKTPVSIHLAWTHEYSSASFYAAEKNGHFAAQNLDVRLDVGGFSSKGYIDPIAQVVNGTVDFGVTGATAIIQARAQGQPVVGIATILQRSPLAILSLANSGIRRPQDLIGRRVAVADGGASQLYSLLLKS